MALKLKRLANVLGDVEHAVTHNPVTNIAGGAVKFIPQAAANYSNAFANLGRRAAGVKPAPIQQNFSDPFSRNVVKMSGATGTGKQLAGDVAQIGLSTLPGIGKGASLVAKAATGAGIGSGFGVAGAYGEGANAKDIAKAGLIGGAIGGALPVAGAGLKIAYKQGIPALQAQNAKLGTSGKILLKDDKKSVSTKPAAKIVTKPTTVVPKGGSITALDKAARSTTGVLDKIDPRLGAMVRQRREMGESAAALVKSQLKVTNSLNKDEGTNLARVLKGTEKPKNDKVAQAAVESRKALDSTYYRAKAAGIPVPGYRKNYFPQIHNPKTFQPGTPLYRDAVDHLVQSGQAKTPTEAISLLRMTKDSRTLTPYGNLSKRRTADLPGYAENTEALHRYLDRSYASIAHAKVMGKDDAKLNKVLADVRKNGGDYEQAIKSYKQASGMNRGSDTGEKLSRIATNIQGATKLGLSSVGNITQQSNTAIVGGVGRTVKALGKQFTKDDKEFVKTTGVTDEQVSHEALFGEQGIRGKIGKVTAPGFERIEKSNRATAAIVGRDKALSLAKKAGQGDQKAAQQLADEFGITEVKKGTLSKEDQIKAARSMVERTQFRTGAEDLPGWASTPAGRVVSQFKRYPYKQAQFLKREVIDTARKGNLAPAARLATVGAPIALGANYVQDKIRGTDFQESPAEKALDIANTATGANLATSTLQGLYPNSHDSNSYLSKVVKSLGGPTVSDSVKAVQAGFDATKGKVANAERFGLQHIPVVGTPISNRALPYANSTTGSTSTASPDTVAGQKATADKALADFKAKAGKAKAGDSGYQLSALGDGRYAYTLSDGKVKTAGDKNSARAAIAKDSLAKSDAQSKTVGNTYYYKDVNGKVKTKPLEEHQFDVVDSNNSVAMDKAYRAKDLGAWTEAANSEYDALEAKKALYNPDTEGDKITDINNKQADLLYKLQGYQEKGINGSGGSSSSAFSNPDKFRVSAPSGRISKQTAINLTSGTSATKRYAVKRITPQKKRASLKTS